MHPALPVVFESVDLIVGLPIPNIVSSSVNYKISWCGLASRRGLLLLRPESRITDFLPMTPFSLYCRIAIAGDRTGFLVDSQGAEARYMMCAAMTSEAKRRDPNIEFLNTMMAGIYRRTAPSIRRCRLSIEMCGFSLSSFTLPLPPLRAFSRSHWKRRKTDCASLHGWTCLFVKTMDPSRSPFL